MFPLIIDTEEALHVGTGTLLIVGSRSIIV
jgi:hypothetical protein